MGESAPSASLKIHTIEKFDGSVWRQYESRESIIVLTSAGRQLVANEGMARWVHEYVDSYLAEASGDTVSTPCRDFLVEGTNARVFSIGEYGLIIKEALQGGDQLLPSLERMDQLINAVERHCPRWIDIPIHYGVLISKRDTSKQFMLMEKVDEGASVGDVLNYHKSVRAPHFKTAVEKIFGPVTPQIQEQIARQYEELKGNLRQALLAQYLSPDIYLPDIDHNPYNVIIEPLDTPVAGSHLKFWVIDQ